jgi:hypothetical protein
MLAFPGLPLGEFLALVVVGSMEEAVSGALGGALAGAVIGAAQVWRQTLRVRPGASPLTLFTQVPARSRAVCLWLAP